MRIGFPGCALLVAGLLGTAFSSTCIAQAGNSAITGLGGASALSVVPVNSAARMASSAAANPQLPKPDIYPSSGKYTGSVSVSILASSVKVLIRYTLDGSDPTSSSPVYSEPIVIRHETTVKAIATAPGYTNSEPVTAVYSIIQQTPTPKFNPPPGKYGMGQALTITDSDATATIRYTIDGSTPTTKSPQYTKPFLLFGTQTIKAIAISTGRATSEVATGNYETPN